MQREFDDLMRSSATMKVSLTPDRLKTMEVSCFKLSQPHFKIHFVKRYTNKRRINGVTAALFPCL